METKVGIVYGSVSDEAVMKNTKEILESYGVGCEVSVMSAHRTPDKVAEYASKAHERGIKVLIAGAGLAAHLAGAVAARQHVDRGKAGVVPRVLVLGPGVAEAHHDADVLGGRCGHGLGLLGARRGVYLRLV